MLNYVEAGEDNVIPVIHWDIIDVCQFKCTYCYNAKLIRQEEYAAGKHQQAWKLALTKLKSLKFDFNISLHGGEPTLHPELYTIVSELDQLPHCKTIVVSSNITADDELYLQFDKPNSKVSIHLSYHPEYHKKIFNKITRLHSKIKHVKLWVEAILYPEPQYYEQMLTFLEAMKQTDIKLHATLPNSTPYWTETASEEYFKLFWPYITTAKEEIKHRHVTDTGEVVYVPEHKLLLDGFSYSNWKCQALAYTIDVDGSIINNCTKQRMPMLLKEADIKKFVTCPQSEICYCGEMFSYKKFKNDKAT